VHNVTPHGYRGRAGERLALRVARLGMRGAAVVGVHTESNAAAARRLLAPDLPLHVIPHGLRPRRAPAAPEETPRFVFFGAYRANKGLDVLVEALRRVPEARLTVAGPTSTADRDGVAALLAPLGDRVSWDPRLVPDDELADVFAGATAAVLPYRDFEAQSGVLHLALEMGIPVVVSSAGGLAEVTRALGVGEVIAALEPAALASALRRISDPVRHAGLRDRVWAAQRELSWETSARLWWSALGVEVAEASEPAAGAAR
jgi:glycosyltransferase involved in cell wall biosynthesis